jgi:hypothetical protein
MRVSEDFVFSLMFCLLLQSAQTLPIGVRAELLARNLPAPNDADDLDQPITDYLVLDDRQGFVIAYYPLDGSLHDLRIRSFDKHSRTWRSTTFPEPIGSVLRIMRGRDYLFISGHLAPSAAPMLVLSDTLRKRRELDGWPELVLDDGRVVVHRSMVHFSPTHAGALALYDPASDREQPLYPPPAAKNERGVEPVPGTDLWMDRSFTNVKKGKTPGTIELVVVEQRMRQTRDSRSEPAGRERRLLVVCNVGKNRPACASRRR